MSRMDKDAVLRALQGLAQRDVPDDQWLDELRKLGFSDGVIAEAFGIGQAYAEATENLDHVGAIKRSLDGLLDLVHPLMIEAPGLTIFDAIEQLEPAERDTAMMLLRLHVRLTETGPEIPGLNPGAEEAPGP